MLLDFLFFFFFQQKTAYRIVIGDWNFSLWSFHPGKNRAPKVTRGGTAVRALDDEGVEDAVDRLVAFLETKGLA